MSPATIVYRKATPDDQPAIWAVRTASIRALCRKHYDPTQTEAWANAPPPNDFSEVIRTRSFLVAECDGSIVAFGFLNRQTSELDAVFVAPDFARRGIGTAIVELLEGLARKAGLKSLTLSASLNAVEFYKAVGYRALAETTWCHPSGLKLSCVAMVKEL